jgi:ATP/ADP translocase
MPPLTPSSFHRILSRFTPVNREELRGLLWSFLCFFTLLASYYVLRPVRDEMGVQTGVQNLPWLFSAVFVSMLVLVVRRTSPGSPAHSNDLPFFRAICSCFSSS